MLTTREGFILVVVSKLTPWRLARRGGRGPIRVIRKSVVDGEERAMAAIISTDNEILVDKVITDSNVKKTYEMESFGRDLVPYFVPGAMELDEAAVNVNTDVDAHRRCLLLSTTCPRPLFYSFFVFLLPSFLPLS